MAYERPSNESTKNGPYMVRNLDNLKSYRGEPHGTRQVTALCRCGGSGNNPSCHGQHWYAGFKYPVD